MFYGLCVLGALNFFVYVSCKLSLNTPSSGPEGIGSALLAMASLSFQKPTHKVVVELQENQWQNLLKIANSRKLSYTKILERFISKELLSEE